ncbi:MAG TPA: hypothetical protein VMX38_04115 [Verrucomicrobiae bacterium]|nr:hypothetical protein [Verrucomicrobiae bacterium]
MFSSRLLVAAALFCSTFLFAQEKQVNVPPAPSSQSTPAAALTIDPLGTTRTASEQDLLVLKVKMEQELASSDLHAGDTYCLKIRSYVVKRDSKDSDATHLVSYSTCQPAFKFQVRGIEESAKTQER